jgi:hypothetical protein
MINSLRQIIMADGLLTRNAGSVSAGSFLHARAIFIVRVSDFGRDRERMRSIHLLSLTGNALASILLFRLFCCRL